MSKSGQSRRKDYDFDPRFSSRKVRKFDAKVAERKETKFKRTTSNWHQEPEEEFEVLND